MKSFVAFSLIVWLSLACVANSRDTRQTSALQVRIPEEREIITREELDKYLESKDDNTGDIFELAKSTFGGLLTIAQIDYTQSGGKIAWEIAEAVVPVIGAALALIPGVGTIVSGVFLGVWSLISPLFAPKKENPIEKMVNELAEKMNKRMDEKLKNLVSLAIYGEISRNNYICNKYTYISQYFSKDFKTNTTLKEIDAVKLMLFLNDCDNFLKDTAEAFVYDEYADVLWVPGALTTSTRLAFLAEIIKVGHLMGMEKNVTVMYFQELKKDIQRQFEYYQKALNVISSKAYKEGNYDPKKDYLKGVSAVETASCKLQSQFFYFDRELYSYGVPTILNNTDNLATIKMQDHYNPSEGNKVKHLQIFFNVTKSKYPGSLPARSEPPYRTLEFQNCLLGPLFLNAPSTYWFNFQAMPAQNKYSYEFRVMYLQRYSNNEKEHSVPILSAHDKNSDKFKKYVEVHKKINKNEDISRRTCLNIEFIYPHDNKRVNETKKLIDIPGWARWKTCPYNTGGDYPWCNTMVNAWWGHFRMYSAGTFNHRNEVLNPLISIEEPIQRFIHYSGQRYGTWYSGFIVGVEIILRPLIS